MKLILLAALLAISTAIPAGFLLGSPYLTQNASSIAVPAERDDMQKIGVVSSKKPMPEVAIEPPKKDVIPQPGQDRMAELPKQEVNQVPQQEALQPPQQPAQEAPQLPQIRPDVAREGIPQNFVFKGALLTMHRAQGDQGRGYERATLNDLQLTSYPKFKEVLQEADRKLSGYAGMCNRYDPEGIGPCRYGLPPTYLEITALDELSALISLVNPEPPRDRPGVDGDIRRQYSSVVIYNGIRYTILIDVTWGSR